VSGYLSVNHFFATEFDFVSKDDQIKIEREQRSFTQNKIFDAGAWIKDKLNYLFIGKNPEQD
jgi:hypothetical protein